MLFRSYTGRVGVLRALALFLYSCLFNVDISTMVYLGGRFMNKHESIIWIILMPFIMFMRILIGLAKDIGKSNRKYR